MYVSDTKASLRKRPLQRQIKPRRGESETPSYTIKKPPVGGFFVSVSTWLGQSKNDQMNGVFVLVIGRSGVYSLQGILRFKG